MIPVIFIHLGQDFYLKYTVEQALKNNNIYLISNHDLKIDNPKYNYVDITTLITDEQKTFESLYQHLSTNPYNFELFCFVRWFILKAFMEKFNYQKVFYIDSDVLLYVDVNEESKKYDQYDVTLLHRCAPVSSYFNKTGIDNFVKFLLTVYGNKNSYAYEKIKSHFDIRQKHNLNGGVCDMTLFEYFHYHSEYGGGPGKVGEMMSILDDSTYDHNINTEDQYFEFNGIKSVKFIDKVPYVYSKRLNKLIKFNSLHFNSAAKQHIPRFYEQS